jgi:hypothetical protein
MSYTKDKGEFVSKFMKNKDYILWDGNTHTLGRTGKPSILKTTSTLKTITIITYLDYIAILNDYNYKRKNQSATNNLGLDYYQNILIFDYFGNKVFSRNPNLNVDIPCYIKVLFFKDSLNIYEAFEAMRYLSIMHVPAGRKDICELFSFICGYLERNIDLYITDENHLQWDFNEYYKFDTWKKTFRLPAIDTIYSQEFINEIMKTILDRYCNESLRPPICTFKDAKIMFNNPPPPKPDTERLIRKRKREQDRLIKVLIREKRETTKIKIENNMGIFMRWFVDNSPFYKSLITYIKTLDDLRIKLNEILPLMTNIHDIDVVAVHIEQINRIKKEIEQLIRDYYNGNSTPIVQNLVSNENAFKHANTFVDNQCNTSIIPSLGEISKILNDYKGDIITTKIGELRVIRASIIDISTICENPTDPPNNRKKFNDLDTLVRTILTDYEEYNLCRIDFDINSTDEFITSIQEVKDREKEIIRIKDEIISRCSGGNLNTLLNDFNDVSLKIIEDIIDIKNRLKQDTLIFIGSNRDICMTYKEQILEINTYFKLTYQINALSWVSLPLNNSVLSDTQKEGIKAKAGGYNHIRNIIKDILDPLP